MFRGFEVSKSTATALSLDSGLKPFTRDDRLNDGSPLALRRILRRFHHRMLQVEVRCILIGLGEGAQLCLAEEVAQEGDAQRRAGAALTEWSPVYFPPIMRT